MLSLLTGLVFTGAVRATVNTQAYTWANVHIGGGGGFVPNIIFNPTEKGLAYARTDIGGAYRLNSDDSWTPLVDFANDSTWDYWGTDALATDPVDPDNLYIAVGMYTNSWDPNNGTILKSNDRGESFTEIPLPFKLGGNMPGRGMGERLAIDPNNNNILYFGARSGHGLWKSTDAGLTWTNVTNFPSVGTYREDPTDTSGLESDVMGIGWVTFDPSSKTSSGSSRIFVGVANLGADNVFVSTDNGATWGAVAGQNNTYIPHHGTISIAENAMYLTYSNGIGPYDGTDGYVAKYFIENGTWLDITPSQSVGQGYGFGGLALDAQKPGTVMVAPLNEWYPDANLLRSLDGGMTWTNIFEFGYPPPNYVGTLTPYYVEDYSLAPWITTFADGDTKHIGWMIEGLAIDPFDSNHWLYGTGLTLYGGHNLLNWDMNPRQNVTVMSLADGIEEMAVTGLTAPPVGPLLVSTVGDDGGFVHSSLTESPPTFSNPIWPGTGSDVDHAGAAPQNIVRLSGISGSSSVSVATSSDSGATWTPFAGAPSVSQNVYGGKIAMSALGDTILWAQATGFSSVMFSKNGSAFTPVTGIPAGSVIASDKLNNSMFYAADGAKFYVSTDGGQTFKQTSGLGNAQSASQIAANPFKAGELYVASSAGIFHSTDFGKTLVGVNGASAAWGVAVGAPKTKGGTPSLFAAATIEGTTSLFRTDNVGGTWVRITDAAHGLSSASSMILAADPNTYGQVFVGTNGRGIFYGHL